ncbi:hypothetical protein [Marinagarivorans cellulosilyticus]|uniref:Phosphoribosyltransferase n=1 Tax=Marinagarivorans cellulosilyticus TaxID=2721545 RepID=A0AAN2BK89_9GAMM|nr:hypothetical protein [Marinagarivorans cellulosilyticus]BCD97740.1 hypothetical protein MARGE09_P1941 [Marinagarivorans cellulosilyticus]
MRSLVKPCDQQQQGFNLKFSAYYYRSAGARLLAHQLKQGCNWAAKCMANEMVKLLPENGILIPIPSRTGKATSNLLIARHLSSQTGLPVCNVITGNSRESIYQLKKQGTAVQRDFFGYRLSSRAAGNIILIDGVCATGITAGAAASLFSVRPTLVVHSIL